MKHILIVGERKRHMLIFIHQKVHCTGFYADSEEIQKLLMGQLLYALPWMNPMKGGQDVCSMQQSKLGYS